MNGRPTFRRKSHGLPYFVATSFAAVLVPVALLVHSVITGSQHPLSNQNISFAAVYNLQPLPTGKNAVINAGQYSSLQAAVDAVPSAGGVVWIPPGTYRIDEPLLISKSPIAIVGSGPSTCILNCNTEGKPAVIIKPPDAPEKPGQKLWRVELAGLRILGDPNVVEAKTTNPKSGDGLLAQDVNELFLHDLTIDHNGGHGINLIDCYEDPRICDCIITYNGKAGLYLARCHDIVVNGNQFEENQLAVHCVDSFNLCMNGNNLDDHRGHGVVIENTYGSVLSGNMIEECQGAAVVLDRDCYGITVSANVIAHNFGGGVVLKDAWGCSVSANTFTINTADALLIGPNSGRITVTGNNFSDSFIGPSTKRSGEQNLATGIKLRGAQDVTITGNQFSGLTGPAIQADESCRHLVVVGNLTTDLKLPKNSEPLQINHVQHVVDSGNICH